MDPSTTNSAARVWFITGATSGLGRSLATAVLERGERVVATARDPRRLADLERRYPGQVSAIALDVTDGAQARTAVAAGVAAFGRLDVIVNSAGYGLFGALEELSDEALQRQFQTNVFGVVNVTRAALAQLRGQRGGHLVLISSLSGVGGAVAGESAYASTKFAVEGLGEVLARETQHLGIRVTIVEPGPFRTDFGTGASVQPVQHVDYDDSVGAALRWFEQFAGQQPNDPDRGAQAIIAAVDSDQPPLHLVLGTEALTAVRAHLDERRRELDAWEHVSASTAFA